MEITKKQWTIIGVVIAVIAIWYFFLRKKTPAKTESSWIPGGGSRVILPEGVGVDAGHPNIGGPTRSLPQPVREQSDCNLIKGCLEDYSRRMLEIQNMKVPFAKRQMMYKKNGASFINCIGCGY
jgi:hypothetical protein